MREMLDIENDERKMVLTIYGQDLNCVVSEPTTTELIKVENRMGRLKGNKRHSYLRKVGLGHLISIEGLSAKGKPLVTDPEKPGYDRDWKRKLAAKSLGMKIAALIVSELYAAGGKQSAGVEDDFEEDDLDSDDLEDGDQEPGEKQPAAGGKAEKSGGK